MFKNIRSVILAGTMAILGSIAAPAPAAEKPNILWITSEDHGPHLGCYGDRNARTPHIDALASRGMTYDRVWSCAPICAPARSAIISGMYPSSTGSLHMRSMVAMPSGTKMLPQLLREHGYYCSNHSKEDYNLAKPDGVWDDSSSRAHWRARAINQPFFAVFNSTKSHESQVSTRPHRAITNPNQIRLPLYHPDLPEVRQDWAQYYDKVSEADSDAGEVLKQINDDGLLEETIVFYFSDHGSGMPRSKRWPSNSGLHVPLVVYFPKKWQHLAPRDYRPGRRSERLVSFVDFAPTVLSIAGIEPLEIMQGQAFAGSFQQDPPQFIFGERGRADERTDVVRSVTDGRHTYIRNYFPHVSQAQHVETQFDMPTTRVWRELYNRGQTTAEQSIFWEKPKAVEELYDLKHDRDEVTNLVGQEGYRDILETLREVHREQMFRTRDVCLLPEGEIHSRSLDSTPYDMAQDDARYPFERILAAAELASDHSIRATSELLKLLADEDSAVRYWAALGFLIRGSSTINSAKPVLQQALRDSSPYVRIVAAQTLIDYGSSSERKPALEVLRELAPPDTNNVFVSMAALNAIDALGRKAEPLSGTLRTMSTKAAAPHPRYESYIPRLVQSILRSIGPP